MMDRVLSYQTAMRAGSNSSGFDIRQFISKRTCISVSLSIGFITLVLGFMLGKSTADRHHALKEHKRTTLDVLHRSTFDVNEIDRIENALQSVASAKLLSTNFNESYTEKPEKVNNQILEHFTSCIQSTFFNTTQDSLEDFLSHIVREEYSSFFRCSENLKTFLQNLH